MLQTVFIGRHKKLFKKQSKSVGKGHPHIVTWPESPKNRHFDFLPWRRHVTSFFRSFSIFAEWRISFECVGSSFAFTCWPFRGLYEMLIQYFEDCPFHWNLLQSEGWELVAMDNFSGKPVAMTVLPCRDPASNQWRTSVRGNFYFWN
jgi:hypothetical protein